MNANIAQRTSLRDDELDILGVNPGFIDLVVAVDVLDGGAACRHVVCGRRSRATLRCRELLLLRELHCRSSIAHTGRRSLRFELLGRRRSALRLRVHILNLRLAKDDVRIARWALEDVRVL